MPPDVPFAARPLVVTSFQRDIVAAVVTGQIAGLTMLGSMMIAHAIFFGGDAWMPLRVIGSIVLGETSLRGDATTLLAGFLMHQFVVTLAWSVVFGVLVRVTGLRHGAGIAALGPMVGMASQLVDVGALVPSSVLQASWTAELLGMTSWFWHVVFGVTLCAFPWVRTRLFPGVDDG